MNSGEILGTKTEAQAHADWLKKAETPDEHDRMRQKISEYERMRRPMHISNLTPGEGE